MLMNLLDEVLKRFSVLILFMMGYLKKVGAPTFLGGLGITSDLSGRGLLDGY
jgi:hypothetical protein